MLESASDYIGDRRRDLPVLSDLCFVPTGPKRAACAASAAAPLKETK